MRLSAPPEQEEEPGQFWKDFIRETAPVFRKSTFEQLEEFIAPTWEALLDGARYVDDRLVEIFDELQPDAIVEDNVCAFPAIPASGRPWVRIASCNPLEMKDPELPRPSAGCRSRIGSGWEAFRAEYARTTGAMQASFSEFCVERGASPLPDGEMIHSSERLNLYLYPEAVRLPALPPTRGDLAQPRQLRPRDRRGLGPAGRGRRGAGALIYVSLGSLGSGDVQLMERLVESLGKTRHRYVVSKGPQHEEYELAPNMIGAEFLPQVSVLPKVDLVITHAGNNTTTECLHFGKPMIALPLFWDQHDNAQRIDETGFGRRLETYGFTDEEISGAIDELLGDAPLAKRLRDLSSKLQASPGTERAADLIGSL